MPVTTRNAHIKQGTTPQKMRTATPSPDGSPRGRGLRIDYAGRPSPYLLLAYPLILAIGSLYAVISPLASVETAMAPGMASDMNTPTVAPNYFAGKRNLINLLFVKRGWAWTTLAFIFLTLTTKPSPAAVKSTPLTTKNRMANHYLQATLRFLLLTITWILVTQWFFGPALIDRSFTLTGGHCENLSPTPGLDQTPAEKILTAYSSTACKRAGGQWRGGHDISGHAFMLVLSSAALLYELSIADRASHHPSVSPRAAANVAHDLTEEEKKSLGGWESEGEARARLYARYFLYAVVGLDCLMLMTTAIWFHTWLEKVNGMLVAGIGIFVTYFLGDFVPAWKQIVGGL